MHDTLFPRGWDNPDEHRCSKYMPVAVIPVAKALGAQRFSPLQPEAYGTAVDGIQYPGPELAVESHRLRLRMAKAIAVTR